MKINLVCPKLIIRLLMMCGCIWATGCTSDPAETAGQVHVQSGDISEMSRLSLARKQALALFDKGQIPYHDVALHTYMIVRHDPLASTHERDVAQQAARLEVVPAYKPVSTLRSQNKLSRAPTIRAEPQTSTTKPTAIPPGLRLK